MSTPVSAAPQPVVASAGSANVSVQAQPERPYRYDDPERDSDEDGIVDPEDRCPTEPGHRNPNAFGHGCPTLWMGPAGPDIGIAAHFQPGSAQLEGAQNFENLSHLAELIVRDEMCALVQTPILVESAAQLSDRERKLGRARAEATRRLLLKKGLPAARIRVVPNTYPRELLESGGSPELFQDTVVLYPQQLSQCDVP
jgi:outer membrane protein OmpA-like peptidoglycan-associated protein